MSTERYKFINKVKGKVNKNNTIILQCLNSYFRYKDASFVVSELKIIENIIKTKNIQILKNIFISKKFFMRQKMFNKIPEWYVTGVIFEIPQFNSTITVTISTKNVHMINIRKLIDIAIDLFLFVLTCFLFLCPPWS